MRRAQRDRNPDHDRKGSQRHLPFFSDHKIPENAQRKVSNILKQRHSEHDSNDSPEPAKRVNKPYSTGKPKDERKCSVSLDVREAALATEKHAILPQAY